MVTMKVVPGKITKKQKRAIAKHMAPHVHLLADNSGNGHDMVQPKQAKQPTLQPDFLQQALASARDKVAEHVRDSVRKVVQATLGPHDCTPEQSTLARQVIQAMITLGLPKLEWAIATAVANATKQLDWRVDALEQKLVLKHQAYRRALKRTRELRKQINTRWGKQLERTAKRGSNRGYLQKRTAAAKRERRWAKAAAKHGM